MWNDKETNIDLLGNDKIAQTVVEIIAENHLRPLTIGVYGDWGVGKSSILSLLEAKVESERKAKVSNSHCIVFNGWLFQGYEDVKAALMEKVVLELAKLQPHNQKIKDLSVSLIKRINWLKIAKLTAGGILTAATGMPLGGLLSKAIEKGKELAEGGQDQPLIKEADENNSVINQIENFRSDFKKLIKSSKVEHIIVLVDDLDRCLPKAVIEILEAIRLFLFVEGTTFVISADERMIEYAVREHFPNLPAAYGDYPRNYLEKLIQIPIRIPSLNRLQTGNYVRLLMLQNYLRNDTEKLQQIYYTFEKKKKRPYDPIEISFDIVTEAIGSGDDKLKEALLVASQIATPLAVGLNGNPRNIKRFLNTMFLRLKIARIYGLDNIIKLNILAKLMLLERFQPEKFSQIVEEVTASSTGISDRIGKLEDELVTSNQKQEGDNINLAFLEWLKIEPKLKAIDLQPYIFISKEKAITFDSDLTLSKELTLLLNKLNSGNELALRAAENEIAGLDRESQISLFERLEAESRSASDISKVPLPLKGLLRIVKVNNDLEVRFIKLMESYPHASLGVWAISELSGITSADGKNALKVLLKRWSGQSENIQLKTLATQTLSRS